MDVIRGQSHIIVAVLANWVLGCLLCSQGWTQDHCDGSMYSSEDTFSYKLCMSLVKTSSVGFIIVSVEVNSTSQFH